jgi:hypothetical protein
MPTYSRKYKGGGNCRSNPSSCENVDPVDVQLRSQPNEENINNREVNESTLAKVKLLEDLDDGSILFDKILRFLNSKIFKKLNYRNELKMGFLTNAMDYNYNDLKNNNIDIYEYYKRMFEYYNIFLYNHPELARLFDLPDHIINFEFDNRFHDRDELINYLVEKEPEIFNFLQEDALHEILTEVKFISQDIPTQEFDGGRRKKTTKKKKNILKRIKLAKTQRKCIYNRRFKCAKV